MDTTYILAQAERAEAICETLDEVIFNLKEAADQLKGSGCRTAEFYSSIIEAVHAAEDEKRELEAVIAQAQQIEDRASEREYWEARL